MSISNPQVASSAAIEHLRWALTPEVGPILFSRIVQRFGSAQEALGIGATRLQQVEGIGPQLAETIARSCAEADLQREIDLVERHGARVICRDDDEYPPGLRHIPDAPICLYVRGRIEANDAVAIAIVGSRRCSIYGREQANRFGYQLAGRGMTVISGLARGIDSEGHKGALSAEGRTIAVLGNGLSKIYPPENRKLADEVIERGALVSELPMATEPHAKNFLPRNRIIAGMTLGTLVIEAAWRSGSLSTAARASDYDREVFAIPGRLDCDFANGTNALIRDQHAKLVLNADDIINELGDLGEVLSYKKEEATDDAPTAAPALQTLTEEQRKIYDAVGSHELALETIADNIALPAASVAAGLIALQLKGLIRQLPGNLFIRTGKPS